MVAKGRRGQTPRRLFVAPRSPTQRDALADSEPLPSAEPLAATPWDDFVLDAEAAPAVCHEPLASALRPFAVMLPSPFPLAEPFNIPSFLAADPDAFPPSMPLLLVFVLLLAVWLREGFVLEDDAVFVELGADFV